MANNCNDDGNESSRNGAESYTILWSTQGGRAKACARRTARILRDYLLTNSSIMPSSGSPSSIYLTGLGYYGSTFDDYGPTDFLRLGSAKYDQHKNVNDDSIASHKQLVIMFVSTTGDGEQCDSIQNTWKALLHKSLPSDHFSNMHFALFSLGDRAYGPTAFCAAGRKLASRLVQLGAKPFCSLGYGDDGTPNGGVFRDLDDWIHSTFLPSFVMNYQKTSNRGSTSIHHSEFNISSNSSRNIRQKLPSQSESSPYVVTVAEDRLRYRGNFHTEHVPEEWQSPEYSSSYDEYFTSHCPISAYQYSEIEGTRQARAQSNTSSTSFRHTDHPSNTNTWKIPLYGHIMSNKRLTAKDWLQDTRHISMFISTHKPTKNYQNHVQIGSKSQTPSYHVTTNESLSGEDNTQNKSSSSLLPYQAGDIATILPSNSKDTVDHFISCLPKSIQEMVDKSLSVSTRISLPTQYSSSFIKWPNKATLRGILTYCADISSLPEREDLRTLSRYCNPKHPLGVDQRNKLLSLSETDASALYADYVIREKRNWGNVLYDFDSIRYEEVHDDTFTMDSCDYLKLDLENLLMILPPIIPRHFSIASAPSVAIKRGQNDGYCTRYGRFGFDLELCIAVVEGMTRYRRKYYGLCSSYLSRLKSYDDGAVRLWIRPGSFSSLPLSHTASCPSTSHRFFDTPVLYVGAGTGIAPLRSLILEREAIHDMHKSKSERYTNEKLNNTSDETTRDQIIDNILVFGCRKAESDYYYKNDWIPLVDHRRLRVLTAFSQENNHKVYVQKILSTANDGKLITHHILDRAGTVYIAGGAKMARAVKEEILKCLSESLQGGEKEAKAYLKKMRTSGRFIVEAWS